MYIMMLDGSYHRYTTNVDFKKIEQEYNKWLLEGKPNFKELIKTKRLKLYELKKTAVSSTAVLKHLSASPLIIN
jgi:hypothetical protein